MCPLLLAGQPPAAGQNVSEPRPVRVCECVCTYVRSLLMDFCPEQQEEDVGAGCIYRSAEFAVTCAARRVCAVHVFCVCLWGAVLSLTIRPDLGVGSWGCGASSAALLQPAATTQGLWV